MVATPSQGALWAHMRIERLEELEGPVADAGAPRRPGGHRACWLEWLRPGSRIDAIGRLWRIRLAVRLAVSRGGGARHRLAGYRSGCAGATGPRPRRGVYLGTA